MKIGNRRLWVNTYIVKLQASLEVIRQENLTGRGEASIDLTADKLRGLVDSFRQQTRYSPFTEARKGEPSQC